MAKEHVTIYGGGMSGMIAAYNLAVLGYDVTVHEKESELGGSRMYNPSTHVTPISPNATSEYIGIDISSSFQPVCGPIPFYFKEAKMCIPERGFFAVERGPRQTSIDHLLFSKCREAGVDFIFDSPLTEEVLRKPPRKTIVACGLSESAYRMLDIPYLRWHGWISRGETPVPNHALLWWGDCITEYGYFSSTEDLYFNLLFSKERVSKNCLMRYTEFLAKAEGIEHARWENASGAVPLASPDNPRLFQKGLILCGTVSGLMDPIFWFGISGAIISGKIAATAVLDPERALLEFNAFTRRFRHFHRVKNRFWYPYIRRNTGAIDKAISILGQEAVDAYGKAVSAMSFSGRLKLQLVPGFGPYNSEHAT